VLDRAEDFGVQRFRVFKRTFRAMDRSSTPVFAKRPSRRVGLVKLKIFLTDSVDNEDVSQLIQRGGGDVQEVITDDTDVILVDENVILDPTVLGIENMEKVSTFLSIAAIPSFRTQTTMPSRHSAHLIPYV